MAQFEDYDITGYELPKQSEKKEEKLYNYLDALLHDTWAENTLNEDMAVVFNYDNICEVETISQIPEWDNSPLAVKARKDGRIYHRELVRCPKHHEFYLVVSSPKTPHSYDCPHCITDEINRVISLRVKRDKEYKSQFKSGARV